jgi:CubicO group peptidase (beta-lactamase class C family)
MHRQAFTVFVFLLSILLCHAQTTIKGRVLNRNGNEPIAYANIGISRTNVGTISNKDGSFSIIIPEGFNNDTLAISSLGFSKKMIPIKFFTHEKATVIYLNEKRTMLQPVVVSSNKKKEKLTSLGNMAFNGGILEVDTNYCGRSIALLIDTNRIKHKGKQILPAYLEMARIRILRNNLRSFKVRLRLNEVDSVTGAPGRDFLEKSIVLESSMRSGWLTFDLSTLNIEVTKPFFLTFEQIVDLQDRIDIADGYRNFMKRYPYRLRTDTVVLEGGKQEIIQKISWSGIDLPGTFIAISSTKANDDYTCYTRQSSFAEWREVRGVITATVLVSSQLANAKIIPPCKKDTCIAQQLCNDFMDEHSVTGMQMTVSRKNKIIWSTAVGYADANNKIPVTDSTRFRIHSISKSMTSLALIKLMAQNKLDLDAPIEKYIPSFPKKPYPVTSRQLAGHLAGFRDYKESDLSDYIRTEHYNSATEALKIFKDDTLLFEPGTAFSYSSFGWNLIGAIIESISGQNYLQYMRDNIWTPLKLHNTCGDDITKQIPNRSKYYDAAGEEHDLGDLSYKYPGGGLLSTTRDLVSLGNELLHGSYIDPALRKLLFQSQFTAGKKETGYGLGWYTGKDKNGHRIWYHAGDSFSGSSYLIIYPDDDLVIAFLANSQEGVAFDVQQIGELFCKN